MAEIASVRNLNNEMDSKKSGKCIQLYLAENNTNNAADSEGASLNFSRLRQKFEEKCQSQQVVVCHKLPKTDEDTKKPQFSSEFQKMYPSFKDCYTKRQFAAIETYFNMADRNQDGYLEPKEVKQLMLDCKQAVNLCDADAIVSIGDHDQDGKLSAKEFLELLKPSAEALREQHHMEGSCPPTDNEFVQVIIQKLRNLAIPVSSTVKGARQFFENMNYCRRNIPEDTSAYNTPSKTPVLKKYKNHRSPFRESGVKYMVESFEAAASQTHFSYKCESSKKSNE